MSHTSKFPSPQIHHDSAPTKPRRQLPRQPVRSRLSLEYLEERTLLNAATSPVGGSVQNLNLNNNFNFASNGFVLPVPGASNFGTSGIANGANPQHSLTFTGLANSNAGAEAASSSFLAQDQLYSQFRVFGVNSQGGDFQREQMMLVNLYITQAEGFGSGTQPNAPWKPNAYNLGLANHQNGYSSQLDMGFSSVPPWSRTVAQAEPKDQRPALGPDQRPALKDDNDEEATEAPEQLAARRSLLEQEQFHPKWIDEDFIDKFDDWKAPSEQQTSQKQSSLDRVVDEDGNLPDSLWLSALAPAPMAALVAGLPGMAASAESGEVASEAAE